MLVALLEFAADPGKAVPAPYGTIIRFSEAIAITGSFETLRDAFRRVVRLAYNSNHFARGENSTVFTTNFCWPQSSTRSVTLAMRVSTMASCSRTDDQHWSTVPGLSSRGPESSSTPMFGAIIGRRM